MAKKQFDKLDDTNIIALVDDNVRQAVGYYDSEISNERTRVIDYYNATLPKPVHSGNSKYVSQDVYDAVESMKSALLETFSSGGAVNTVKFDAVNADDVSQANTCTNYVNYVAHRQNDMFSVMSSVIHDALVARNGIAKVYWQEQEEVTPEYFENLNPDELDMLISQDNIELSDSVVDEFGFTSGEILVSRDTSQVIIENIAPEEFLIEPQAKSLDDVSFVAHRTRKTLSELREEGYSEEIIGKIGDHSDVDHETDPEVLARFDNVGSSLAFNNNDYQDQVRSVQIVEAYIHLDIEGSGIADLWRITKAGNALLSKVKVTRKPFITFSPIPIPHSFFGSNFGDKVVPTQNARTVLTRSILDHAVVTNNPRYMVTKGSLPNPRELIDNRVGGIVNVTRPDAITPMMQPNLNPFVFQTIKMLDEQLEDTTGVAAISQGLNKDAVSKQNSAAMIEQLQTMSQQRQKIIARHFATQFIKPMYQEIYALCVENEDQEKIVDIGGEYVAITPAQWADKRDVTISLHLGYGEQERESQKMIGMHQTFTQDPSLQRMYTPNNQYELMKKVMELNGIKDATTFLTPPEQLPEPQPDPAAMMQMELAQKQMEIQERQTVIGEAKLQSDIEKDKLKHQLDVMKAENQFAIQSDQVDIKEDTLDHKKAVDAAELELANRAEEITAIASPNA
mgnify:CR=1 FL=1|tara:strand:+ start:77 stop:2113 length:2037 start_codon:yes stop_codon:yes gene_type:complete